jgi:hypothetical protein
MTVLEFVPILSTDTFIADNAKTKISMTMFIRIGTNHHVMFRRFSMMLFENECVNIAYYLIEELMKMLYRHHQQHLENNEIDFVHSKRNIYQYIIRLLLFTLASSRIGCLLCEPR